jgi:hypothetical protein
MSQPEKRQDKLQVELSATGFHKSMFFNRFHIEREDEFCLVQFGLVSGTDLILVPLNHVVGTPTLPVASEATGAERITPPEQGTQEAMDGSFEVDVPESLQEWDNQLEREFRKLALREAKGLLNRTEAMRLEELNFFRDRLKDPQLPEEMLLQIRRDRLLARMEELLNVAREC